MSAEKKSKKTTTKKGAPGTKKPATAVKDTRSGGNNSAFFMLIIVILITIIVLMLNRFYDKGAFKFPDFKKIFTSSAEIKDKKTEIAKDKTEARTKSDIKDNIEKNNSVDSNQNLKNENTAILQKDVSIYLLKLDEKTERIYLNPVKRTVTDKDILAVTLENLIKGPTQNEKSKGFITAIPAGLKIRSISINGKTAEIDFSSSIEEGAAGDILLKRVQQIVYTATQFDSVNSIIIKINGQRRKSMGSDGFSISGPLKR